MTPLADPQASYLAHQEEIDAALRRVLHSGRYVLGQEGECFEEEFAAFLGARHALGVASGTDALVLALRACGVQPGDGVVTVSHTSVATVAAIELAGAVPILIDVDPNTYVMSTGCLGATLRQDADRLHIRAVLPVHLYGYPAPLHEIVPLARHYGLQIIEDCCQAHGATLHGQRVGTWGDAAAFSFYPTKNLSALGDGGAVVTNDTAVATQVRQLREYGWRQRFISEVPGQNSRLDELQAAVLRVKLTHLERANAQRQALAAVYREGLEGAAWQLPPLNVDAEPVYHQFVLRGENRDALRRYLAEHEVGTGIHYPVPIHMQPAYHDRVPLGAGGLPQTEALCREIVSLPMYPELSKDAVEGVAELMNAFDSLSQTAP